MEGWQDEPNGGEEAKVHGCSDAGSRESNGILRGVVVCLDLVLDFSIHVAAGKFTVKENLLLQHGKEQ